MAATDGRRTAVGRFIDAAVFAGFAVVLVVAPGPRRGFEILLLLAIAGWGYRYAAQGLSRVPGVLAFVAGWFGYPLLALVGLWIVAFVQRAIRDSPPADVAKRAELARLTLRTALAVPGRVRAFRAPFDAAAGRGEIPLLMANASGEVAFYLEAEPWEPKSRDRFLDWIARLRASDRSALHVEVRGAKPIPQDLLRACRRDPDVLRELAERRERAGSAAGKPGS